MTNLIKVLIILVFLFIIGWLFFVYVWGIPAPVKTIEKEISIERLKINE